MDPYRCLCTVYSSFPVWVLHVQMDFTWLHPQNGLTTYDYIVVWCVIFIEPLTTQLGIACQMASCHLHRQDVNWSGRTQDGKLSTKTRNNCIYIDIYVNIFEPPSIWAFSYPQSAPCMGYSTIRGSQLVASVRTGRSPVFLQRWKKENIVRPPGRDGRKKKKKKKKKTFRKGAEWVTWSNQAGYILQICMIDYCWILLVGYSDSSFTD